MAFIPVSRPRAAPASPPAIPLAAKAPLSYVQHLIGVWRQRQQLRRLPEHLRRDIGLTRAQIADELARPVWDAPQTWRR